MSRIGIFLPGLGGGGAERVLLLLAGEFTLRGHDVDLILVRAQGELIGHVPENVRLVDLKAGRRFPGKVGLGVGALVGLTRYLRKAKPAALLSSITDANVIAVLSCKLARVKTKLVLREAATLLNLKSRWIKVLMKWLYPFANKIVVLTEVMRCEFVGKLNIPEKSICVIPNPVDIDRIQEAAAENKSHSFPDNEVQVIIGVGRLVPQKDFSTLIQAFSILRKRKKLNLVLLGEGELRQDLDEQAKELGIGNDVFMPGFDLNPYRWIARADVFVLSSRWEGFPNVLVEAMALGKPVVATDCPSGPDEILQGGRCGYLVPIGDVETMAKAITDALKDGVVGELAYRRVCFFNKEGVVNLYQEVLLGQQ